MLIFAGEQTQTERTNVTFDHLKQVIPITLPVNRKRCNLGPDL